MSGGFFRGTSADQDTRFSNKQAKLLKSQKFPAELDHLVDMRKVKMDVIRPWIATRATELLGFEDEVLINFVYGLLDGKEVDGKKIQIQLTGFMEKNTGKFMKELWGLLLSAQKNASGVPQQFLDAKEEEMKKKKAETDRIALEIQKRREKEMAERVERGHRSRNDDEADISRSGNAAVDTTSKHSTARAASVHSGEERELDVRRGRRSKDRYSRSPSSSKSPLVNNSSAVLKRDSPSATRSSSKTFSKSRSYSEEKRKSRSASISSKSQRHSSSPERRNRSPARQSVSPARRYRSPPRRSISPRRRYSPRNRSPSRRRHRSPSLTRRRSPHASSPLRRRQRSPSPTRRRSPHVRRRSPVARRRSPSPLRRRSPSPPRRRSPVRRRSPSPYYRRSPPIRRRSPSPLRRRSPLSRSPKHRRRSPLHSARNRAVDSQVSPLRSRKRSRSPPRNLGRRSMSRERDSRTNGVGSKRYENEHGSHRTYEKRSPYRGLDRGAAEHPDLGRSVSHRLPTSLRSPQQDSRDRHVNRNREAEKSLNQSHSPGITRETMTRKNRRSPSMSVSPVRPAKEQMRNYNSPKTGRNEKKTSLAREDESRGNDSVHSQSEDLPAVKGQKKFHDSDFSPEVYVSERPAEDHTPSPRGRPAKMEVTNASEEGRDMEFAERHVRRISPSLEGVQYGTARARQSTPPVHAHDRQHTKKRARDRSSSEERGHIDQAVKQSSLDGCKPNDEKWPSKNEEFRESHHKIQSVAKSKRKDDRNESDAISSDSEDAETYKSLNMEKRRHKRSDRHKKDVDDTSESDSQVEDRKEAKKRKKEEKKLRKEEKRRRREEKHRRKLERRANKLKLKPTDTVALPSDKANNLNNSDESDVDVPIRNDSLPSSTEEAESEQKKLEFELRKKALESLRLKKAISH